jgi:hypothetical protein
MLLNIVPAEFSISDDFFPTVRFLRGMFSRRRSNGAAQLSSMVKQGRRNEEVMAMTMRSQCATNS